MKEIFENIKAMWQISPFSILVCLLLIVIGCNIVNFYYFPLSVAFMCLYIGIGMLFVQWVGAKEKRKKDF